MKVIQVRFQSGDTRLTAWVEDKVKPTDLVSFKNDEPERLWKVISVDSEPVELSSVNRGWNNNI